MSRGPFTFGAALAATLVARAAAAGDGYRDVIVAATPDGGYQAAYHTSSGSLEAPGCGLEKVPGAPSDKPLAIIVAARCEDAQHQLLPLEKWTWERATPEIKALRAFDPKTADSVARIAIDDDTQLRRLEVRQAGAWAVVRVLDGNVPWITGALETPRGYVLRASFSETLAEWDAVWTVTRAEASGAPERRASARKDAVQATARMREHRARGTGVFAPVPPGTPAEAWERRRRHGIATFVRKWETVAAYGPLDAAELRDALWLLAWFESPTRRHEALRWYTGLGERDAPGAAALRADLAKDPDARALADYLATARVDTSGAHR